MSTNAQEHRLRGGRRGAARSLRVLGQGIAEGEETGRVFKSLRALDLLAPLSDEQLRKTIYFVKTVEFDAGETIFEKGEAGESFYVIRDGRVEARVLGFFGAKVLGAMGPGEFFGELALILSRPRAAAIVCTEPTVCFVLDRSDLEILMERSPDIADAIKRIAKQRFNV
ncbi:MAG: cyclic nucleotide-binding domain-containing protein [Elusimicrobiota bacterium]